MLQAGRIIDNTYQIGDMIGSGGSGHVYAATSARLHLSETHGNSEKPKWAIKEAHTPDMINSKTADTSIPGETLRMEVELLKELSHPSLVKVVDVIRERESLLMVMEYVSGRPLDKVLEEEGALSEELTVRIGMQIADVLGYLHSRGHAIIYRDLKPSNLILRSDGRVVLVDFGAVCTASKSFRVMKLAFGTRGYAAPEQYAADSMPDEAADVYAFGRTLTAMLTGGNPALALPDDVSRELRLVIKKCTRRNKNLRYRSVSEVYCALRHLHEQSPAKQALRMFKCLLFVSALIPAIVLGTEVVSGRGDLVYTTGGFLLLSVVLWFVLRIPCAISEMTGIKMKYEIVRHSESARVNGTFRIDTETGIKQAFSWDDVEIGLDDTVTDLRIDIDSGKVQFTGMEEFVLEQDEAVTLRDKYKAVI